MAEQSTVKVRKPAVPRRSRAKEQLPIGQLDVDAAAGEDSAAHSTSTVRFVQGGYRSKEDWGLEEEDVLEDFDYAPLPSRYPSETVTVRIIQGGYRVPDLAHD